MLLIAHSPYIEKVPNSPSLSSNFVLPDPTKFQIISALLSLSQFYFDFVAVLMKILTSK